MRVFQFQGVFMRHRVDISFQSKAMLQSIADRLGTPELSNSSVAEMCIQSVHQHIHDGNIVFEGELNPVIQKLDEIISMLQEISPEV